MKRTQITELLANIRGTFVSFFSILMFVALGIGIFVGIFWTAPSLEQAADKVFDEGALHHVQVTFPYGLTQGDIDELSRVEGVSEVEETRQAFATVMRDGSARVLKLQTIGANLNKLDVIEGELPTDNTGMALKASVAQTLGISVGDVLTFVHDADDTPSKANNSGMARLVRDSFTVTALVESPEYLSSSLQSFGFAPTGSGLLDGVGWLVPSAFDDEAYQGGYTTVNVASDSMRGMSTYSPEYAQASLELEQSIAALGDKLAPARYAALHTEAQKQVEEGEAKLKKAEKMIAKGERAVKDGEKKLKEGKGLFERERAAAEAKLRSALRQLRNGESLKAAAKRVLKRAKKELRTGEKALAKIERTLATAKAKLKETRAWKKLQKKKLKSGKITKKQYNKSLDKRGAKLRSSVAAYARLAGKTVPRINHSNFDQSLAKAQSLLNGVENVKVPYKGKKITIRKVRSKIKEFKKKVAKGEKKLASKVRQLSAGWSKYYSGKAQLARKTNEYKQQVRSAKKKIKKIKAQVKDGKAKVKEKKPELEKAKEQLAAMREFGWTVAGRSYNGGAAQVTTLGSVCNNLALSMAALFVIVGLLVSYSAVSRIVHEQITQIGTKKALGLRGREITLSFLAYATLAVVAGAIVGITVGVLVVEGIIGHAVGARFTFGDHPPYFGLPLALGGLVVELILVLGATWLACRNILREQAVELLKGEKPPQAKTRFYEKWGLWDKLPLFTQTIVNNCVNDKRRVFSTIVGVAGCTALVVTAITLNDDVLASYDKHYQNVCGYDTIAYVDPDVEGSADRVDSLLQEHGAVTSSVYRKNCSVQKPDGTLDAICVVVPEDADAFGQLYHVNAVKGASYDPSSDGVWVSQAYAEHLGAKAGDTMELDIGDGTKHKVTISGFHEFYLTYHELVMGRSLCEKEFGSLKSNAVLAKTADGTLQDIQAGLNETKGYESLLEDKAFQRRNFDLFSSISTTVVLVYLLLAVLMAVVVLLNLNVMFIEEKKRELIVLMINGFSVKHAKRYIYNDSLVLTVIGILLGLVLGTLMGIVSVMAIESSSTLFFKGIAWRAVGVGAAVSAVLAFVMGALALRRIPKFRLTDINRF